MERIEFSAGKTLPSEQVFARKLQTQVRAWMAAKPDRRSTTDSGVPVVRRRRTKPAGARSWPPRSRREAVRVPSAS